jgi:hypothetical protein
VGTRPTLDDTECHGQDQRVGAGDVQEAHSRRPPGVQPAGRRWRDSVHPEVPVFTVAVLVVFFALLTLADVLPGQSSAPGLVAPLR